MNRVNRLATIVTFAAMAAFALLCPAEVAAQATRTWVSGVGDDANPCSRTAPCKTFAGAISKTAASGEISVLDPGGFGAVTITKSITIDGGGVVASILSSGANGIIVNAAATDVVTLRNLSINGGSTGLTGVRALSAGTLILENVSIEGQTTYGIEVLPSANPMSVYLRNVTIRRSVGSATDRTGIVLNGTDGSISAHLENVAVNSYMRGLHVRANAAVHVDRSSFVGNDLGVWAAATGANVYLSDTTVTRNITGLSTALEVQLSPPQASGTITSYNNNRLRGNTTDGAVTTTIYTR